MNGKEAKKPANAQSMGENAPMATTPEKRGKTVKDFLESETFKAQIKKMLPDCMSGDRFIRSALNEFRLNKDLAQCNVPSVLGYFLQAAALGLEPASTLGQCYAVPYYNKKLGAMECQFILGYRGMLALARRSGDVLSVDAHVVHALDTFELEFGMSPRIVHKPYIDGNPGAMRGAYIIVRFKDNSTQCAFMTKDEIDAHRKRSRAADNGPWITDYEEMAKKTVFRAIFKWLPIVVEAAEAEAVDGASVKYNAKTGEVEVEQDYEVEYTISNGYDNNADNAEDNAA